MSANREVMVQVKARDQNPVQEWLKRVAEETGDPDRMETWGLMMQNDNTKRLIVAYAKEWRAWATYGQLTRNGVLGQRMGS